MGSLAKKKKNSKPIQRCCKVVSSLLSAYKLIFSFQCWVHIWNGGGFSSKKCSVTFQTHLCESTLSFQSEFHSVMTCHVHVLSFKFLLLATHCGKSWVTDSCSPAPSHSWSYMLAPYHLANFSFPTPRALEGFSTSKISSLTLLVFSSYGHWICEMWTCLGVANSTEMPSGWFAALFPIMLSHLFVLLSTVHH